MAERRAFGSGGRAADLSPASVAARLTALRRLAVLETEKDGRARLARERPFTPEPFPAAVQRRLGELRALCELAGHLRGRLAGARRDGRS